MRENLWTPHKKARSHLEHYMGAGLSEMEIGGSISKPFGERYELELRRIGEDKATLTMYYEMPTVHPIPETVIDTEIEFWFGRKGSLLIIDGLRFFSPSMEMERPIGQPGSDINTYLIDWAARLDGAEVDD